VSCPDQGEISLVAPLHIFGVMLKVAICRRLSLVIVLR
jgi:hypothetical protein